MNGACVVELYKNIRLFAFSRPSTIANIAVPVNGIENETLVGLLESLVILNVCDVMIVELLRYVDVFDIIKA
jgi:hypothetical protein